MADQTQLLYLEPDDEVTTLVRRLRETDASRVVVVAPGRSKVAGSVVALRLLAQVAAEDGRQLALVADAAGRSLAGEAGIPAFGSVAEAAAGDGQAPEPPPVRRAPIRVVRGEEATAAVQLATAPMAEETQVVAVAEPVAAPRPRAVSRGQALTPGRRWSRALVGALVAVVLLSGAALAAVAPAATITIEPQAVPVGPVAMDVRPPVRGPEADELSVTRQGTAGGERIERTAATGSVTFQNWNTVVVEVPEGTEVSVGGGTRFVTVETIRVPNGLFAPGGITPGTASVGVRAVQPGAGGNVAAEAIDTVETRSVMVFLRGFPNFDGRLVFNPEPTSGGADTPIPVIRQEDVDAVVTEISAELQRLRDAAFAGQAERLYPPTEPEQPAVEIPEGLVGREGEPTFELTGTLAYARPYVLRSEAEEAAAEQLREREVAPPGTTLVADSIRVELGAARLDGESIVVEARVTAEAAHDLDEETIRRRVAGLLPGEVDDALGDIGPVEVRLWPGWVDRVPRLEWRIEVEVAGAG